MNVPAPRSVESVLVALGVAIVLAPICVLFGAMSVSTLAQSWRLTRQGERT